MLKKLKNAEKVKRGPTNQPTDQRTDQRTDIAGCRVVKDATKKIPTSLSPSKEFKLISS